MASIHFYIGWSYPKVIFSLFGYQEKIQIKKRGTKLYLFLNIIRQSAYINTNLSTNKMAKM